MTCLVLCTLSVLLAPAVAHGFPLKSEWSARISGENHREGIAGTFLWDSGRMEAHWKFNSSFAAMGLEDTMGFTCSFSDQEYCTSQFRKGCFRGLMPSRTESLVKLLTAMQKDEGTHDGDCSAYSSYIDVPFMDTQLWSVQQEGVGNLTMCITSDGFPLGLVSFPDKDFVGQSNVEAATYKLLFHDVTLGPQNIKEPTCPDCPATAAPCSGEGVISMEVLRMTNGGGEPWTQIWNMDTGDAAGEMMFDTSFGKTYIKVFNVTVNSSWGPSRDCNFKDGENVCSPPAEPSLAKMVTRQSAELFEHPCGGQCTENKIGSWYIFPKEGGCPEGSPVGTDGCTWRVEGVKVVTTDCVKSTGEYDLDLKEPMQSIYSKGSTAIWKGIAGCPDIRALRR